MRPDSSSQAFHQLARPCLLPPPKRATQNLKIRHCAQPRRNPKPHALAHDLLGGLLLSVSATPPAGGGAHEVLDAVRELVVLRQGIQNLRLGSGIRIPRISTREPLGNWREGGGSASSAHTVCTKGTRNYDWKCGVAPYANPILFGGRPALCPDGS